jgi:PTH1 family peptidyl-tRNA hydrolase
MKLITGLGNPGDRYEFTRHNVGFLFVDMLREKFLYEKGFEVSDWRVQDTFKSDICFLKRGSTIIAILQKPLTFMNNSGEAVSKVLDKFEIKDIESDFLLVHDDLDIPLGRFKIQEGKSPIGHNGIKSVEEHLKNKDFRRIRIGVENRNGMNIPGEDYVLTKFSKEEQTLLNEVIENSIQGILADIIMTTPG